jgi:hypothetical protein
MIWWPKGRQWFNWEILELGNWEIDFIALNTCGISGGTVSCFYGQYLIVLFDNETFGIELLFNSKGAAVV